MKKSLALFAAVLLTSAVIPKEVDRRHTWPEPVTKIQQTNMAYDSLAVSVDSLNSTLAKTK
jgi:hypothetical protein